MRLDLHRGVHLAGGSAADHQGNIEILALHFLGEPMHLVEGGRNEARQPDDVDIVLFSRSKDGLGGHHHAQIDDLEVVALQHHADDILADVVHIALHRGHKNLALGRATGALLGFDERHQVSHGFFHHPCRLHHLR